MKIESVLSQEIERLNYLTKKISERNVMNRLGNTTAVSAIQEFYEKKSRLPLDQQSFTYQQLIVYCKSIGPWDVHTIGNGFRSMVTNLESRKANYRIVENKEWADGKKRDLFFKEGETYRLYNPDTDPKPLYYTGTDQDAEEAEAEEQEEAAAEEAAEEAIDPILSIIPGLGKIKYFNPFDNETFPTCPGVYLFKRPDKLEFVRIGKGKNLRPRIISYKPYYWYRPEMLSAKCWYIEIEDKVLREMFEAIAIKLTNPMGNVQHIGYEEDEEE
jgi:hypothetical protein